MKNEIKRKEEEDARYLAAIQVMENVSIVRGYVLPVLANISGLCRLGLAIPRYVIKADFPNSQMERPHKKDAIDETSSKSESSDIKLSNGRDYDDEGMIKRNENKEQGAGGEQGKEQSEEMKPEDEEGEQL